MGVEGMRCRERESERLMRTDTRGCSVEMMAAGAGREWGWAMAGRPASQAGYGYHGRKGKERKVKAGLVDARRRRRRGHGAAATSPVARLACTRPARNRDTSLRACHETCPREPPRDSLCPPRREIPAPSHPMAADTIPSVLCFPLNLKLPPHLLPLQSPGIRSVQYIT